jgi:hypothetical protein
MPRSGIAPMRPRLRANGALWLGRLGAIALRTIAPYIADSPWALGYCQAPCYALPLARRGDGVCAQPDFFSAQ